MGTATSTAAPERARWPRLAGSPHPQLRFLLPRGYAAFTEATTPRHLVLPATTSVPLVVKIRDSPHRPPAFVMGAHGSPTVVEGECAPSYLEVSLAPLAAYTLLGVPMEELGSQLVDLADVLGPAGRRLGERLREAPSWPQRFALLDQFLLRRLERGPRARCPGKDGERRSNPFKTATPRLSSLVTGQVLNGQVMSTPMPLSSPAPRQPRRSSP